MMTAIAREAITIPTIAAVLMPQPHQSYVESSWELSIYTE